MSLSPGVYQSAIIAGDRKAIELFLKHGYEVPPYAVPYAIANDRSDFILYLLEHGADINGLLLVPSDFFELLPDYVPQIMPALGLAVYQGDLETAELLLAMGASPSFMMDLPLRDEYFSAVHLAVGKRNLPMVSALVEAGSPVNVAVTGGTPIALAAANGELEIVKVLAEAGAYISYDSGLEQPIEVARKNGHRHIEEYLYSVGVPRPNEQRVAHSQPAQGQTSGFSDGLRSLGEAVVAVLIIGAGIAIAVEAAKHSAYSPPMYLPQSDSSDGKAGPTPQVRSRNAPQTAAESSECSSDYSCGIGRVCVKKPYQNSGICMRSVDAHGSQVYGTPRAESIGPRAKPECQMDSDCPVRFKCHRQYQVCVIR